MDNSMIGAQIVKFRKAAGLTQEELGRAVGVSTQAVSRWECGGAPDVALLPAIADKLGVTIDALFGREVGEAMDTEKLAIQWGSGVSPEQLIHKLNLLVWAAGVRYIGREVGGMDMQYLQSCESMTHSDRPRLVCSSVCIDQGIFFGVGAEDMAFSTICPKPEKGYSAFFSGNDSYRELFSTLALPGCLELMEYMLGRTEKLFAAETLAKGMEQETAAVEELLERLEKVNLMGSIEVALPTGLTKIYQIKDDGAIVPFLYLARALMDAHAYYLNWNSLTKPLL